ncbi:MAG: hypothetical protein LAN84_00395 [Acidobacteriia bacterium]|nr:hypothetical protein [Terriglobia bacterium]
MKYIIPKRITFHYDSVNDVLTLDGIPYAGESFRSSERETLEPADIFWVDLSEGGGALFRRASPGDATPIERAVAIAIQRRKTPAEER